MLATWLKSLQVESRVEKYPTPVKGAIGSPYEALDAGATAEKTSVEARREED
jgi:hypothetical protein